MGGLGKINKFHGFDKLELNLFPAFQVLANTSFFHSDRTPNRIRN
jgi:hypothetical protein